MQTLPETAERPPGVTVNNCSVCQELDAVAATYAAAVARSRRVYDPSAEADIRVKRRKHEPECPDPRGGGDRERGSVA